VTFAWDNQIPWAGGSTKLHWLHVAGLDFVVMMAIVAAFRYLAPRPEAYTHEDSAQVDMSPWRLAVPAGLFVVIAVIAIYAYLWSVSGAA
jgi:SSS family solute:Na+ symporter